MDDYFSDYWDKEIKRYETLDRLLREMGPTALAATLQSILAADADNGDPKNATQCQTASDAFDLAYRHLCNNGYPWPKSDSQTPKYALICEMGAGKWRIELAGFGTDPARAILEPKKGEEEFETVARVAVEMAKLALDNGSPRR